MKYSVTLQQNFKCITVQKTCMSRKQKSFRWILTTSRERRSSNTILVSVLKCMRQASWQLWWNTIKSKFLVQWNYKGSTSSKWDGGLGVGGSGRWGAINVFVSDKVTSGEGHQTACPPAEGHQTAHSQAEGHQTEVWHSKDQSRLHDRGEAVYLLCASGVSTTL